MASGGPDLLNELSKELLICNICLEDFNYDDHSPRILPCHHSFCSSCLDQLIRDGKCKCPNCRVESQVGARVPFDTTRLKVLDAARVVRSREGVSCQGCTEGAKATHHCHDCEDFLCQVCSTAHRRVKLSKDHKLIPMHEVGAEKLGQLKVLLREIGRVVPSIQLDASRCGGGCCVGTDLCSLSNQASPQQRSRAPPEVLKGPATCATAALPGISSYWQVRCKASPKPWIFYGEVLCEFGVAPQQALQAWPGNTMVFKTDKTVLSVVICTCEGQVFAVAYYRKQFISTTDLCPFNPHSPVDLTLGLLLDTATARMHVIDVGATQVLGSSDVDLSTPLWPFVCVWPETDNGARVEVEVQSGQQIGMTGDLVRLLQSVLGGT